ncbi:hypothetical protein [Levilactobacillus acidifarinae]|uniref:D-alanyl-D-alanine carboxypeptidase n=1 Tax=Levilactobacillus acidifarinae DSM 19394 = JCM 15949 TaxID=1423715 RepID=A0A0R1LQB8_9LACO|nr:hypothetical protein [Levilactobacillus acidifarinae]KRK94937.1 hypothetical protein FD25_GL002120 [Levilactobacillus acidifarinae DSM 19394]GEO70136.1 hypothetical protein LAC03_20460 [Levilactobacillus acidifarinae]
MKVTQLLLTALVAGSIGGFSRPAFAQQRPSTWQRGTTVTWNYRTANPNGDFTDPPLASTATTRNVYLWNLRHTEKLHDLKNFPKTTWYVTKKIEKPGSGVYDEVTTYDKSITGLIWHGYLAPYVTRLPDKFKTTAAYAQYIRTAPEQKLARGILQAFPQAKLDLRLSQEALHLYNVPRGYPEYHDVIDVGALPIAKTDFTQIQGFPEGYDFGYSHNLNYYWLASYGGPVALRVAKLHEALATAGWTPAKLASLGDDWHVGVVASEDEACELVLALPNQ